MKIIVDCISLLSSLTGIGRYNNEIVKRLKDNESIDVNYFYGYYSKKYINPSNRTEIKSVKALIASNPVLKKIARKILMYVSKVFSPKYDLYWQPNLIPLDGIRASKTVTTVHDFSFYVHPKWHPQERLDYFNKYFFKNVKKSDWIITGSKYSKEEIIKYLNFPKEKITVIYHAIDKSLYKTYSKDELGETKKRLGLKDDFLLFVGSIEPRKNLLNLLKAYELLSADIKKRYPLVLVGFKGWENTEVMELIDKNSIEYLGFVSDNDLARVYNLASCFIYPSLYEGFGLPPLESMACGTPVITSNITSIPEVCEDAAIYVDPYSIKDIKEKIIMLLEDKKLQEQLIDKGLQRVKEFSWEKSANEHIEVFKKVLKS